MLLFKVIGNEITPLAPNSASPDDITIFDLPHAAAHARKTEEELRVLWMGLWGNVVPATDLDGKPLSDPLRRPAAVKLAAVTLTDAQREELVREKLYPHLAKEFFDAFKVICDERGFSIYWPHLFPEQRFDEASGKMKLFVVTTITGYGAMAIRTGDYDGPEPLEFAGEEKAFHRLWDDRKGPPVWARAGVRRKSFSKPVYADVQWHTYAPYVTTPTGQVLDPYWEMLGSQQLGKCALAYAYRLAFPDALNGIYIREEMQQSKNFQPAKQQQHLSQPTADPDCQATDDEVTEEEFNDLLQRAAPKNQHDLLMKTYQVKYSKFWKFDRLRFYRVVAKELRQLIREMDA